MPEILPHLVAALLYAGLAWHFWRTRWMAGPQPSITVTVPGALERHAVLLPLAIHAALLYEAAFPGQGLHLGFGVAVSSIVWLTVLVYWLGSFWHRLDGLQALMMPVAAGAVLLPALVPTGASLPNTESAAFRIHLLIAMLSYSLFTIASLHVLLMALIERRLHHGTLPPLLQRLPPLLAMEALLFRIIWAGFVLLTLTLASGVVFSEELFGKAAKFNHKTLFGVLSWLIFGALLAGRMIYGWRGRVAVRWTLAGFLTLVLAYIGSKFVLEVILGRG